MANSFDYPPVNPQQPPAPTQQTSTMAIVSLVASITGITILPLIGSIVGIITGHMAKNEIKNSGGTLSGDGLATAGLVIGYITVGLGCLGLCIAVVLPLLLAAASGGSSY